MLPGGGTRRRRRVWEALTHVQLGTTPARANQRVFGGVGVTSEEGALLTDAPDCPAANWDLPWSDILSSGTCSAGAGAGAGAATAATGAGAGAGAGAVAGTAATACSTNAGSDACDDASGGAIAGAARAAALGDLTRKLRDFYTAGGLAQRDKIDKALPSIAKWLAAPNHIQDMLTVFNVGFLCSVVAPSVARVARVWRQAVARFVASSELT